MTENRNKTYWVKKKNQKLLESMVDSFMKKKHGDDWRNSFSFAAAHKMMADKMDEDAKSS
jgi:hypothetical protein